MCGIVGYYSPEKPVDKKVFTEMRDSLAHRGPDDADSYFSEDNAVALGHRRLSLLDLSEKGRQPMSNRDGSVWVTYNGEIYNYLELRAELKNAGYKFLSETDTEVLIHGYTEWGKGILSKLKGMFAFGIWDSTKRRLFLARDRFGIKPLYYSLFSDGSVIFASEIKAILKSPGFKKELRIKGVADYLVYRFIPSPYTIWEDVFKLPPAHAISISDNGNSKPFKYWHLEYGRSYHVSEKDTISAVDQMLNKSVGIHTRADVQVGSFLSGGYDSSTIVSYLNNSNYNTTTYTAGFDSWPKSEHQYAKVVADYFKMKNKVTLLDQSHLEELQQLMYYYDEPIADISIIPTFKVSALAAQDVKAVLSGEGADELFVGYHWSQQFCHVWEQMGFWSKIKELYGLNKYNRAVTYYDEAMAMGHFDYDELKMFFQDRYHERLLKNSTWFYQVHYDRRQNPVKSMQILDMKSFMGELVLTKIDRAAMANSLEVRLPFLDHEIFEYMAKLDHNIYFRPNTYKYLLRKIMEHRLPNKIIERPKQGFVGPDAHYMNFDWYENTLQEMSLVDHGILNDEYVRKLISNKDHWRLWKIVVLEYWARQWLN